MRISYFGGLLALYLLTGGCASTYDHYVASDNVLYVPNDTKFLSLTGPIVHSSEKARLLNKLNSIPQSKKTLEKYLTLLGKVQGLVSLDTINYPIRKILAEREIYNIVIFIESGGGDFSHEAQELIYLLNKARKKGVSISCVVKNKVFSLATVILSSCDHRYAIYGSSVGWHSATHASNLPHIQESIQTRLWENFINDLNTELWRITKSYFSRNYFSENFIYERQIPVEELEEEGFNYITVIKEVRVLEKPSKSKEEVK